MMHILLQNTFLVNTSEFELDQKNLVWSDSFNLLKREPMPIAAETFKTPFEQKLFSEEKLSYRTDSWMVIIISVKLSRK